MALKLYDQPAKGVTRHELFNPITYSTTVKGTEVTILGEKDGGYYCRLPNGRETVIRRVNVKKEAQ